MAILSYPKNSKTALSKNFKVYEFACKGKGCCETVLIDEKLVSFLQKIRDHFGAAVTINSGYRCAKHNKAVGGSSNSYHTKGQAADIVVADTKPAEIAKYAESLGVLGIGLYDTFVHIDTRTNKFFWYSDKQEPRSTFGGKNAVKTWQKAAIADGFNLPSGADGIWGKECESVAKKAICKKPLVDYDYKNKNLTKFIQNYLGFTDPDVDGLYGAKTQEAVKAYQKSVGFTGEDVDGIVGLNTWKKILGV